MRITIKVSTVAAVGATTEVRRCTDTMLLLFHGHFFCLLVVVVSFFIRYSKTSLEKRGPKR